MSLIELFFQIYFIFLLIRLLVPNTGQMAFNQGYQFTVRVTEPVLNFMGRIFPLRVRPLTPLLGMFIIIFLQGLIYNSQGRPADSLNLIFLEWKFNIHNPFWGEAKSLVSYLILLYKTYAFLFLVNAFAPLQDSVDQLSRLLRKLLQPFGKIGANKIVPLIILFIAFSLIMTVLGEVYAAAGIVKPEKMFLGKALFASAALLVELLSVFIILIVVRAILSWLAMFGRPIAVHSWLEPLTEPLLKKFRRLGVQIGAFDLTPVITIFALVVAQRILLVLLSGLYAWLPGAGS